jgi:hypothetical protein
MWALSRLRKRARNVLIPRNSSNHQHRRPGTTLAARDVQPCRASPRVAEAQCAMSALLQRTRREYGQHPALRPRTCLQCYGKTEGVLCAKCSMASALEHRAIAGALSKHRGSPCQHCPEESIGAIVFTGNKTDPLCEKHAREYRSLDFTPRYGFVTYGSIGALKQ